MRLLVCGSRNPPAGYDDFVWRMLDELAARKRIVTLIHGYASGVDSQAMIWAETRGVKTLGYRAEWHTHGKAAGPMRNQRMLELGKPDMVAAFNGGRGTADMVARALGAGVPVVRFDMVAAGPQPDTFQAIEQLFKGKQLPSLAELLKARGGT